LPVPNIVQQAFLHIAFQATVSTLHRPQLKQRKASEKGSTNDIEWSTGRVEEAAVEISRVNNYLHKSSLDRYLPPTAITLQLPAIITHIKRIKKQQAQGIFESLGFMFSCIRIVQKLQVLYVGGDLTMIFIKDLMERANVTLYFDELSQVCGIEYGGIRHNGDDSANPRNQATPITSLDGIFASKQIAHDPELENVVTLSTADIQTCQQSFPSRDGDPRNCDDFVPTSSLFDFDFEATFRTLFDFESFQNIDIG